MVQLGGEGLLIKYLIKRAIFFIKLFVLNLKLLILKPFQYLSFSIVKFLPKKVILTYDNGVVLDGIGAQFQRIFAIRALADNLLFDYLHTGLKDITTHPLDPFQSSNDRKEYVNKLNDFLSFCNSNLEILKSSKLVEVDRISINLRYLIHISIKSILLNRIYLLKIVEPYDIIDLRPDFYLSIQKHVNTKSKFKPIHKSNVDMVLHYRRGVGNYAIYGNQTISRELPESYYHNLFLELTKEFHLNRKSKIVVLTDSPINSMKYFPPKDQLGIWEDSPRFKNGVMYISAFDSKKVFQELSEKVEIICGGDPLNSLLNMANAQILVLSRSSFSYVAAILNSSGVIYAAPNFWHKKLKHWREI